MIRSFLLVLYLLASQCLCRAQNSGAVPAPSFSVSGTLKDTVNFMAAGYASVSLIRSADSVLQAFTRADEQGHFVLKTDTAGAYLLMIAHPSFAIQVDEIKINQPETNLGDIILTSRKQMLDEVVITDAKAIVIKGDTIEYAADSFQTRAYDNVDELLKKLPGIEVDRNGKIKAYGKDVQKMTVDGEEFFSDDPAVVAQTLRASAVDKVQVFDKKSDQAAFTGVDDGELTKTINLKLKEDAKRGYFGKLSAGGGLPEYWENQAMVNSFKKKRKMSAYGIMSNTNTTGLGWQEREQYGGGGNSFSQDEDGNWISDNMMGMDDSWNGQFNGQGLPRTWTAGGHYSNKWMGDTLSFNGSYRYSKTITEGFSNSRTQYILPDTQYTNTNNTNNTSISQRHAANTVTEFLIDSSSSLKLTLGGNYSLNDGQTLSQSQSAASDGSMLNDITNLQQNRAESKALRASLFYRKRFRKKGRTISADFTGNWNSTLSNGSLNSAYSLFAVDSAYTINQRKQGSSNSLNGRLKVSYTEPLSKVVNLEVNYAVGISNNDAENSSYDRGTVPGGGNEYTDVFNPLFSSHYVFNTLQNQGGANLRFSFKKLSFSFGGAVSDTRFRQEDLLYDTTYSYSYFNFFPRASLTFNKSQTSHFSLRYNGRTQQPTISQLQPLRNNRDPLNVAIGNPDLKQEFSHTFNLNYNSYKMLTSSNIYANLSLTLLQNAISQRQDVDITGRRTYQFVNTDGNYNLWAYTGYGRKVVTDVYARGGIGGSFRHSLNYTNGLENKNNQLSISPYLSASYRKDTILDLSYDFRPAFNSNTSSIRTDVTTRYWSFEQQFDGSVGLPFDFRLGTSVLWNIRQRLDPQDRNNNVFRWNAYLTRSFLKDKSLVAKVYVNDILDQNVGYSRYNAADYVSENTYNTIRRYFLFSLTWNFTKTGVNKPSGDVIIIQD